MKENQGFHVHSTHWNKMASYDLGRVIVISCETALFFVYIFGLFHGMQHTAFYTSLNSVDA